MSFWTLQNRLLLFWLLAVLPAGPPVNTGGADVPRRRPGGGMCRVRTQPVPAASPVPADLQMDSEDVQAQTGSGTSAAALLVLVSEAVLAPASALWRTGPTSGLRWSGLVLVPRGTQGGRTSQTSGTSDPARPRLLSHHSRRSCRLLRRHIKTQFLAGRQRRLLGDPPPPTTREFWWRFRESSLFIYEPVRNEWAVSTGCVQSLGL